LVLIGQFFRVHEDIGDLLLHLCADLDWNDCVSFGFEEKFTLSSFEETNVCNLKPEKYFMVYTRQKLIELFYFWQLDFEHGAGMLQKLLSSFSSLVVIETNATHTILALFCVIEDVGD
jgi:hypothetical protein